MEEIILKNAETLGLFADKVLAATTADYNKWAQIGHIMEYCQESESEIILADGLIIGYVS